MLSRKPEASLHLQTGKRKGKAPHLSHTGLIADGGAGMNLCSLQPPPPSFTHLMTLFLARDAQSLLGRVREPAAAKGSRELAAFLQKLF